MAQRLQCGVMMVCEKSSQRAAKAKKKEYAAAVRRGAGAPRNYAVKTKLGKQQRCVCYSGTAKKPTSRRHAERRYERTQVSSRLVIVIFIICCSVSFVSSERSERKQTRSKSEATAERAPMELPTVRPAPTPAAAASNGSATREDEWVFSIRVPAAAASGPQNRVRSSSEEEEGRRGEEEEGGGRGRGSDSEGATGTTRLIELRQGQTVSASASDDTEDTATGNTTNSTSGEDDTEEKASLLASEKVDGRREKSAKSSGRNGPATAAAETGCGWTFTSPFWNLQSENLLTVTYFPAWQALPEYTNRAGCCSSRCCDTSDDPLSGTGGATAGMSSSCGASSAPVDYASYTYCASDVVRSQSVPNYDVPGVGKCQAVKLYLEPFPVSSSDGDSERQQNLVPDRPAYLDDAWERQLEQIRDSRQQRMNGEVGKGGSSSAFFSTASSTAMNRDDTTHSTTTATGTTSSSTTAARTASSSLGPILTFCLPSEQVDPPLLWRVEFPVPSQDRPVAVEALTVLDGCLFFPRHRQPSPTHIYIVSPFRCKRNQCATGWTDSSLLHLFVAHYCSLSLWT